MNRKKVKMEEKGEENSQIKRWGTGYKRYFHSVTGTASDKKILVYVNEI